MVGATRTEPLDAKADDGQHSHGLYLQKAGEKNLSKLRAALWPS
jgi:hypothetical protein